MYSQLSISVSFSSFYQTLNLDTHYTKHAADAILGVSSLSSSVFKCLFFFSFFFLIHNYINKKSSHLHICVIIIYNNML